MKRLIVLLCGFAMVFSVAGVTGATSITNGDFETGNFNGWSTAGDVRIANTSDFLGIFAEEQGMSGYYALLGLENTDGTSTLSQTFEVDGVDQVTISFNWAFDYWDNSASAEDTFLSLVRQTGTPVYRITLLDLQTNGGVFSPDAGVAHGFFSDAIDISNYTEDGRIIFRLIEESDRGWLTGTASVAGIDNVNVAPVPEPSTILLMGVGLLGLVAVGRRKFNPKE